MLKQTVPKDQIIEFATTALAGTELTELDFRREISIHINKNLFSYTQLHLDNNLPSAFFPIARWRLEWKGEIETKEAGTQSAAYSLEYDFQGRLVQFDRSGIPQTGISRNIERSEALQKSIRYLLEQKVDTTGLSIVDRRTNEYDGGRLQYEFTFHKASVIASEIVEAYELTISGDDIVKYQASVFFDTDEDIVPPSHRSSRTVSLALTFVVWVLIIIFAIAWFFKKIRHDELEFKRGLQLGIFMLLVMWVAIAITNWGTIVEVTIGGAVAGLFGGLGIMIVYSVTDSLNRDVCPEQFALTDVLWRGFWRVREVGQSFLDALSLTGLSLFYIAILFWLVPFANLGHLDFENESFQIFYGLGFFGASILDVIVQALFVGFLVFAFWGSYLKSRLKNQKIVVGTFAVFLNLAGLHLVHIQPTWLAFLLFMPLAIIWSYTWLKVDIITVLLSIFLASLGWQLILLPTLENAILSLPSITYSTIVLLTLVSGCLFLRCKRSVSEFAHYVPSYVSRIAERERFLKELEIARHLQMRFLPQAIPNLHNLDIACVCKPAMEVGGDYYDFIQNGNNSLGVIIGDVSGKGVSAAFYMTMAKGIIMTLAKGTNEPKKILSQMNTIFYENVPKDVFISVMYGEFDMEKNVLRFARAGHNPLIICRGGDGSIESFLPKGLAIGLDAGNVFERTIEEVEIPFQEDDIFIFFTDGISESTNGNGDEFGDVRLYDVLKENAGKAASTLVDSINSEIANFSGERKQHDDLTMVVVKVGNPG